jgi:hypothetical protein
MSLPDIADEWDSLEKLNDRHLVIEVHLIIEEYLDELLKKIIPDIEKALLKGSITLSYEQKIRLVGCFLTRPDFLNFPKMVQRMRNQVAHHRTYQVKNEQLKEFFKRLVAEDKEMVRKASKNASSKLGKKISFDKLAPRIQFLLLTMWFTIGLKVEIQRIISGPHYETL